MSDGSGISFESATTKVPLLRIEVAEPRFCHPHQIVMPLSIPGVGIVPEVYPSFFSGTESYCLPSSLILVGA